MAVFNFELWDNWVEAVHDMGYKLRSRDGRSYYIDDEFINENFFCIMWTPLNNLDACHPKERPSTPVNYENLHPIDNLRTQVDTGMDFHWELSLKETTDESIFDIAYAVFPETGRNMTVEQIKDCLKRMKDPKDLDEHITLAHLSTFEEEL
jgi:hypothetical protein